MLWMLSIIEERRRRGGSCIVTNYLHKSLFPFALNLPPCLQDKNISCFVLFFKRLLCLYIFLKMLFNEDGHLKRQGTYDKWFYINWQHAMCVKFVYCFMCIFVPGTLVYQSRDSPKKKSIVAIQSSITFWRDRNNNILNVYKEIWNLVPFQKIRKKKLFSFFNGPGLCDIIWE